MRLRRRGSALTTRTTDAFAKVINANIRFAHAISIMRIVAHLGVLKRHSNGSREPDARAAANAIRICVCGGRRTER